MTADGSSDPLQAELLREDVTVATLAEPEKRLPSAATLADRLENLEARREKQLAELELQRQEQLNRERDVRLKRLRGLLAASVAVLLLVGGLGVYAWQAKNREDDEVSNAIVQEEKAKKQAKRADEEGAKLSNRRLKPKSKLNGPKITPQHCKQLTRN